VTAGGPVPNTGRIGTEATAGRYERAAAAVTVSGDAAKSEASVRAGEKRAGAPHKWLIAGSVILGPILEVLDSSIINVSLPHMQGSFSASVDEVAWVVTSYLVANGVMIPMTGWISSRFGRKRYFMLSLFTFVCASALCGTAQSLSQMIIFRLVQGLAGAAMVPSSQAIMMETFPPEEQQMAMATWGVGMMVAPVAGPTLGGWITDNWNWRWNFFINVPIGIVALLMVSAFVHDPTYLSRRRQGSRVDWLGITCLVLWLGLLQIVSDRGQRAEWFSSPWVVWASSFSAVAMVILIFHELHFPEPIIELHILKIRQFSSAVVVVSLLSFILFGSGFLTPIFLQEFMGYSAWRAGLVMLPRAIAGMGSMLLAGQIARAGYDNRRLIGVAFTIVALGLWRMAGWNLDVSVSRIMIDGFVLGAGLGLSFPILSAAALSSTGRESMGYAASLYNMTRNTGAAVGIAYLTNMLLRNQQVHQSYLVQHFSAFDAWRLSNMGARARGAPAFHFLDQMVSGRRQGLGMVYGLIQQQAEMLAFNDIYRMLAVIAFLTIPSFILFRGARSTSLGAAPH
jgi:MFS transporter, DHA2 family, multidrug resistance protein